MNTKMLRSVLALAALSLASCAVHEQREIALDQHRTGHRRHALMVCNSQPPMRCPLHSGESDTDSPALGGGTDVHRWQQFLLVHNFSPGAVDGQFGTNTANATKSYQSSRHLNQTGMMDCATFCHAVSYDAFPCYQTVPACSPCP